MAANWRVTDRTRGLYTDCETRSAAMHRARADSVERPANTILVKRDGHLIARYVDGVDVMGEEFRFHGDERGWVEL